MPEINGYLTLGINGVLTLLCLLNAITHIMLTLTLCMLAGLLSSADNLCKQLQNVGPDLDPNRLTL